MIRNPGLLLSCVINRADERKLFHFRRTGGFPTFAFISPWIHQGGYGFETLYIQNGQWLKIITLAKKKIKINNASHSWVTGSLRSVCLDKHQQLQGLLIFQLLFCELK